MADRVTCSDGCCIFEGADGWTNIGTPRERALQYRAPIAVKFCPETGEALLPDGRTEPRPLQAHIDVLEEIARYVPIWWIGEHCGKACYDRAFNSKACTHEDPPKGCVLALAERTAKEAATDADV